MSIYLVEDLAQIVEGYVEVGCGIQFIKGFAEKMQFTMFQAFFSLFFIIEYYDMNYQVK
jgi:hypothetical protein